MRPDMLRATGKPMRDGYPANANAPAASSTGRQQDLREQPTGASDCLGCAAAILACGGDLRVVERVVHRPVSGQRIREFEPSGKPTLRLRLRPRKPRR